MLFDGTAFAKARMNYNAHEDNTITHGEMAELEHSRGLGPVLDVSRPLIFATESRLS